jgi:hypothetical protein
MPCPYKFAPKFRRNHRFSAPITKGEGIESARANLREAIELYLETWA